MREEYISAHMKINDMIAAPRLLLSVVFIYITQALFRNKSFALNEMFQQNASKFAIFYV